MGRFSHMGSRATERIQAAATSPTRPPDNPSIGDVHREGSKWWTREGNHWVRFEPTEQEQAAWIVDRAAEQLEESEKVCKSLARALRTGLVRARKKKDVRVDPGGWYTATGAAQTDTVVTIGFSIERWEYSVEVDDGEGTYWFIVSDEALVMATNTVKDFNDWIAAVCPRVLHVTRPHAPLVRPDIPGPDVHVALANLGVTIEPRSLPADEEGVEQAIASIKRSLS